MKILILSINHIEQIVSLKDELKIPEIEEQRERLKHIVTEIVRSSNIDMICEESDPRRLSIAQELAFGSDPRIPWKNIHMSAQERLEAGIWESLLYRPFEIDGAKGVTIDIRIPEDDVRENFFRDEILKAGKEFGARSALVLCGDMHTESLREKLQAVGCQVETNHEMIRERHWK